MIDIPRPLLGWIVLAVLTVAPAPSVAAETPVDSKSAGPATADRFTQRVATIDEAMDRDFAEAESLAVYFLETARNEPDSDMAEIAVLMGRLVSAYNKNGKAGDETLELSKRVVAIQDSLPNVDLDERLRNRRGLADLYRQRRMYKEALAEARLGLDLIEAQGEDDDHPYEPYFLSIIGVSARRTGDVETSRNAFRRGIEVESRLHDEPTVQLGSLNSNLGNLYEQMGDRSASIATYLEAIRILEQIDDATAKSTLAVTHRNIAVSYSRQSLNAEAIRHLDLALEIQQEIMRPNHPHIGYTYVSIANNAFPLSDYQRAVASAEKGLEVFRSNGESGLSGQARALLCLAAIAGRMGDLDGYEARMSEVGEIYANNEISTRMEAGYEQRMGLLRLNQERMDEALAHLQRAVELSTDHAGLDWYVPATYLAVCHLNRNEFEIARDMYLDIIERRIESGHVLTGYGDYFLALSYNGLGLPDSAITPALLSEERTYARMRGQSSGLPEATALALVSQKFPGLDLSIGLIDDVSEDIAEEVWNRVVLSRAVVYEELASRSRGLIFSGNAEIAALAEELRSVRERLANETVKGPGRAGVEAHVAILEELAMEKEQLEIELVSSGANLRSSDIDFASGGDVRQALPEGSVLVSFARYREHDGARLVEPAYMAFVTTTDRCEAFFLGSADEIDRAVSEWWEQAAYGGGRYRGVTEVTSSAGGSYFETGCALRRLIWDPLADAIGEAPLVFVVPDGRIHHVNFLALPRDDGSYLVESSAILHTLSAERDLVTIARGRENPSETESGQGLLALGGADFEVAGGTQASKLASADPSGAQAQYRGRTSDCEGFSDLRFAKLDGSARESKEVAELWNERFPLDAEPRATLLQGSWATESAFKRSASRNRVLHLATHGFFLGGDCVEALGDRDEEFELDDKQVLRENPLLLSGLVLAGANQRGSLSDDGEDGILTAEEIAALDLRGTEWAVLSACETAAGTILSGEGVLGLRRAFALAGVEAVIMSLWTVEDDATRDWMNALYRARFKGASTAEAVRTASLEILEERRRQDLDSHPFYWASFVAAGSWH